MSYKTISYLLLGVTLSLSGMLWMSSTKPVEAKFSAPEAADGLIGEVILFSGNFAPRNWAFCHGQMLQISQNQALFSIIGTTYGGDGRTTFALPDLRGRAAVGVGSGSGLPNVTPGGKKNVPGSSGTREALPSAGLLGMNYIICVQGTFPSRN